MLFFCKHGHDDESVQVDSFAQHPEVVTAHQIHVDEHDDLTAHLEGKKNNLSISLCSFSLTVSDAVKSLTESLSMYPCFFSHTTVMTEFSTKEKKRFLWSVILWQLRLLGAAEEVRQKRAFYQF